MDMIGRNGHQRWPEALELVERLWPTLPARYRYHHLLAEHHERFVNWDCSNEGFEGIRAQDILPLLLKNFRFHKFLGFGGLTDVFIDRGYGHNLRPDNPQDTAFIDLVACLEGLLTDLGHIKPTQMAAVMGLHRAEPRAYRHWTPEFCVRDPAAHAPGQAPVAVGCA
jgi:hypothetical protein